MFGLAHSPTIDFSRTPSLTSFVDRCIVPYLYAYSIVEGGGVLPFGELSHGARGLHDDLASMLGVDDDAGHQPVCRRQEQAVSTGIRNHEQCNCCE
jgi:hypothetical protein